MSYSEQIEALERRICDLRREQDKAECEENNHELYLSEAFTFEHLNGRIIHKWGCQCGQDEKTIFKDTGESVTADAYKFPPDVVEKWGRLGISSSFLVETGKISLLTELFPKVEVKEE